MGMTFYDLTCEELCDLMCGDPEDDDDRYCERVDGQTTCENES